MDLRSNSERYLIGSELMLGAGSSELKVRDDGRTDVLPLCPVISIQLYSCDWSNFGERLSCGGWGKPLSSPPNVAILETNVLLGDKNV